MRSLVKRLQKCRFYRKNPSASFVVIICLNSIFWITLVTDYHHVINKPDGTMKTKLRLADLYRSGVPLVTLFTTFKVTKSREQLNKNTLRLWAALLPEVQPVLFSTMDDDVTFLDYARDLGWFVYLVPSARRGYPILRDMYLHVINHVTPKSPFIGYANSDIVFTEDLIETLTSLVNVPWEEVKGQGLLLTGRRSDIHFTDLLSQYGPITRDFLISHSGGIKQGSDRSMDYFITTADGYPLDKLPDFVVGKPGFDNYIVVKALDWDIRTVDCSVTLTALHQVTQMPNFDSGWFSNNSCMNRALVDPFYFGRGATECAQYVTNQISAEEQHSVLSERKLKRKCKNKPLVLSYPRYKTCEQIVAAKLLQRENYKTATVHPS